MILQWNDSLTTGHPRIDNDHRRMVEMVNRLGDAMVRSPGAAACGAMLDELIRYAKCHFAMEEALMRSIGGRYTDTTAHKAQHAEMLKNVLNLQARLSAGTVTGLAPAPQFLQGWLLHHIKESDKALAAAANSALRPAASIH